VAASDIDALKCIVKDKPEPVMFRSWALYAHGFVNVKAEEVEDAANLFRFA